MHGAAQNPPAHAPAPGSAQARHIIGHSPAMQRVRRLVARLQNCTGSVIVTGEPGAGKELVARGLRRPGAPFVTVDAATIASSTAESTLFGHERGAFTGAHAARAGLLEQAHGGMLYVDEIANMAIDVQAKLLRALQEKEVTRLGGQRTQRLSFRVICATNQNLEAQCRAGLFRFDLYTRLSVFTVSVPPLRQRQGDIPALFTFFCRALDADVRIAPEVWPVLAAYSWPGNVRELSNAAQYAIVMGDDGVVDVAHLPDKVRGLGRNAADDTDDTGVCGWALQGHAGVGASKSQAYLYPGPSSAEAAACQADDARAKADTAGSLAARLHAVEADILRGAYRLSGGNVSRMARQLRVDRSNLHVKLRRFGIHPGRAATPVGRLQE